MIRCLITLLLSFNASATGIPVKFLDSHLKQPAGLRQRFDPRAIESKDFVQQKSDEWQACHQNQNAFHAMAASEQRPDALSAFAEVPDIVRNLQQLDEMGLRKGRVAQQPWSGDFWPYAHGILGARPFEDGFVGLENWLARFQYIGAHSAASLLSSKGAEAIAELSPAEKYDLLVDDEKGSFTQWMWSEGKVYQDEYGKVEEWMGICHGWAPAAIMEPRPTHSIQLSTRQMGWQIPLNPSEIKGLVSYSWATNPFALASLGQRCTKKDPVRDANGRLTDPECFDLNPATWHLAVTNRVGRGQKSFVLDATYDYEVWNQPILIYEYRYFNPQTGELKREAARATVKREDFSSDRFAAYRSTAVKKVVGISMVVGYVIEVSAVNVDRDFEQMDQIRWVNYKYDLELDDNDQIIGGEWYEPSHPDFIWTPLADARPLSPLDWRLNQQEWDGNSPVPDHWANAARASSAAGFILDSITKVILRLAN